jgi:hypothetical protein
MGLGDDVMATAIAYEMYKKNGVKVAIGNKKTPQVSPIFENLDFVITPEEYRKRSIERQWLHNCPGHRHYIDYKTAGDIKKNKKYVWKKVGPLKPGHVEFGPLENIRMIPENFVLIDPHVKLGRVNKSWGFDRYTELVRRFPDIRFVQPYYGKPILPSKNVSRWETKTIRMCFRLIRDADLVICNEGAIHHLSAALGTKAIVMFGGFISPDVTGYDGHYNMYAGGEPCGNIAPCDHCREAMESITVDLVATVTELCLAEKGSACV